MCGTTMEVAVADELARVDAAAIEALRQEHIGRLLLNAQRTYSLLALTQLRERGHEGLSLAHTNLLAHLEPTGTRMSTLAARAGVTKQAIGSLVGELEAKGYVRREQDPDDRRAVVIRYTDAGWEFLRDAHAVKQDIEATFTAALGDRGMTQLRRLLSTLVRESAEPPRS